MTPKDPNSGEDLKAILTESAGWPSRKSWPDRPESSHGQGGAGHSCQKYPLLAVFSRFMATF